jgi:hypothetical protein
MIFKGDIATLQCYVFNPRQSVLGRIIKSMALEGVVSVI